MDSRQTSVPGSRPVRQFSFLNFPVYLISVVILFDRFPLPIFSPPYVSALIYRWSLIAHINLTTLTTFQSIVDTTDNVGTVVLEVDLSSITQNSRWVFFGHNLSSSLPYCSGHILLSSWTSLNNTTYIMKLSSFALIAALFGSATANRPSLSVRLFYYWDRYPGS